MKLRITLFLFCFLISGSWFQAPAHAACFNPPGNAGDMRYNGGYRVKQYCNGGNWVSMGPVGNTTSGLIGWWKLDETSGTSAADSSGTGNTGTLLAAASWTTDGMNNGALTLNGTTQSVSVPDVASLELAGSWTVSSWVNPSAIPTSGNAGTLISKVGAGSRVNYWLGIDNASWLSGIGWLLVFQDSTGTWTGGKYVTPITTGTWYHVVGVYDSTTTTKYLYLNGTLVVTQNVGVNTPTGGSGAPLTIGGTTYGSGNYLASIIDDVRVYNRALSATDIKTLYTSTGGTSGDINTGLTGYWKFDEASGTSAADSSGNTNTGTTYNSPTWAAGKVNNALTFNGTNQYVDAGNGSSLNLGSTGTVAMWLNTPVTDNGPQVFLTKGLAGGDLNDYMMYLAGSGSGFLNHIRAELANGTTSESIFSALTMNDGNWHHFVFTWDGSFLHLYLDGVENATPVAQTLNPVSTRPWPGFSVSAPSARKT